MRFLLFTLMALIPSIGYTDKPEKFAQGRVLLMPRAGLPMHEFNKILAGHNAKVRKVGQSDLYIADIEHGSEKSIAARLSHHPHFKFAEVDHAEQPELIPNDPYYFSAWHLPKIGAPAAWDQSMGAGVTVAVLDSGVDAAHPDLSTRLVPGWNFFDNNSNTSDVYGHGTVAAGTVAAASNNSTGVASVSGQSKIMPIRVTDTSGAAYTSMIASGLIYAADRGIRVANISFANMPSRAAIVNASQYMKDKGGLVVVAAGNSGINENFSPTTAMIPVSATDANDLKTTWSSYGSYVAIAAPGVNIWSTSRGGSYGVFSGTSVATPVAAGVIALTMAANTALTNGQVESLLYSTAVDLGDRGRDSFYGYGRVDAAKAVLAASSAKTPIDVEAPSISITSPHTGDTVTGIVQVNVSASDNVGVSRVELRANNNTVAVDGTSPFAFSWDSSGLPNGQANLVAYAFDAAGNSTASSIVGVNVANTTTVSTKDTTPPSVQIVNPVPGTVSGNVSITVNASDNNGSSGVTLSLYIDGALKATGKGSTMGYTWNTNSRNMVGKHQIQAVAKDLAGNSSLAAVSVSVAK